MSSIQHSSCTNEWYTPPDIVKLVHQVLGQVDLDPTSSPTANRYLEARQILTAEDNALECEWPTGGSVYLNPPGGKTGNKSNTALFWQRLMAYRGELTHAIFMAFSIEAMQTTQGKGCPSIGEFPICVPRKRIAFYNSAWNVGPAPSHSNLIAYVPGRIDRTETFREAFSELGLVRI